MPRRPGELLRASGSVPTYNGQNYDGEEALGGYSQEIVVSERFTLGIPDGIALDEAAPLLCAGITVYTPLTRWGAGPGKKVAVVGMGGLGHMAVKIAAAMGADVTVLSQSTSKAEDGEGVRRLRLPRDERGLDVERAQGRLRPHRLHRLARTCRSTATCGCSGRSGRSSTSACPRTRSRSTSAR